MNAKVKGYSLIIVLMGAFALLIYGAYSPARKAQKQQIICVKFRPDVNAQTIDRHMNGFAALRYDVPQIVGYSAGRTLATGQPDADYDVVHYLTFQSEADMQAFANSAAYRQFAAGNRSAWQKTLTVSADIRP